MQIEVYIHGQYWARVDIGDILPDHTWQQTAKRREGYVKLKIEQIRNQKALANYQNVTFVICCESKMNKPMHYEPTINCYMPLIIL
jgi:hypothetical protein